MQIEIKPKFYADDYLFMAIDKFNIFEYDWTDNRWRYCKVDAFLGCVEEISKEEAEKIAKFQKENRTEKYKRLYAISPHFL